MFFMFMPKASFVEMDKRSGFSFLRWAFAAMRAGVSVMPLASFAMVFPVQGKRISRSRRLPGPIGSASEIVSIGFLPVIRWASFTKSSAFPKRLSMLWAASEKIVCIWAPSSASFSSS